MKVKRVLFVILAIFTIFALAACKKNDSKKTDTQGTSEVTKKAEDTAKTAEATKAPEKAAPTAVPEKVVLRMAWWGSQARHDKTVKVIELYESKNPNVDIQFEFFDFEGYFTKLNTLVASNEVWDCFQLGGNFPTYMSKIVPLNDYIKSGIINTSQTTETLLKTTQDKGVQIGVSNGVNTYGIAYDPEMFKQAGVPEPTQTWTWDDFKNACLTIHEKLGIFGSSKLDPFNVGCGMGIPQNDLKLNFYATTNDKLGFDDYKLLVPYMQLCADLTAAGAYPDPGAINEIKDIEGDYLVKGEAAMTWVASNQFLAIQQAAGKPLKIAVPPRRRADGPSGMVLQSSQMFCVSKDSKNPEEAAKFLNFFWTDEEANKILSGERGISIFTNVLNAQAAVQTPEQKLVNDYVNLIGSFTTGDINVISPAQSPEIQDNYKLMLEKVVYKEKTADEAAKEFYDFAKSKFN